ncbi:unnamed protein product [Protopolystoma xenopodis]|uniref:Uncharacterized protein n=1 Tax=Protopolystoma xenopodis TaxID=117903 RepID=A0A448X2R4_9PLAT|nr:unnamed protein product [Protopolystoma xenopodis]
MLILVADPTTLTNFRSFSPLFFMPTPIRPGETGLLLLRQGSIGLHSLLSPAITALLPHLRPTPSPNEAPDRVAECPVNIAKAVLRLAEWAVEW